MILTFHSLEDSAAADAFPEPLFARGMAVLRDRGYRTVDLAEWVRATTSGEPVPPRSFVLTFDDGYRSILDPLGSLLASFGWTATVFLTASRDGSHGGPPARLFGREVLSWREAAELQRAGATFGAHGMTHPDLTRLPRERARLEISRSKTVIEDRLGVRVTAFAYPFGRHDGATRRLVRAHYDCACSDRLGIAGHGSDRYSLERIDAHYLRHERLFAAVAKRWFPLYVAARAVPRHLRRALRAGTVP